MKVQPPNDSRFSDSPLPPHVERNLAAGRVPPRLRRLQHDFDGTRARILAQLRAQLPEGNRVVWGWREIGYELARLGFPGRKGSGPTADTLRRWRKRYGLPVVLGRNARRPSVSTIYNLTAWLLAHLDTGALPRGWTPHPRLGPPPPPVWYARSL
jgi:hypothetical protein